MNKLNCMNYLIDDFKHDDHFYLTCGIDCLKRISKKYNLDFLQVKQDLLNDGQFYDKKSKLAISMI